jgi:tetratricopeptide (TPR) repeat protein
MPQPSWAETTDQTVGQPPSITAEDATEPHSLVGSYLAGRLAKNQYDNENAAEFYRTALAKDPTNEVLLDQSFLMEASGGNWALATKRAEELVAMQSQHRMARLVLGLAEFKAGNLKKAEEHFKASASGPIGELTSALALAWVKLAEGNSDAAMAALDVPKQAEWAQFYLRYHKALIADVAGKRQEAKAAYDRVFRQDSKTLRTALAYARHAASLGDVKQAKSILRLHIEKSQGENHPLVADLMDQLDAKRKLTPLVSTARDGLAEVFYGLGEALAGEGGVNIGVLYLQMALHLEPQHPFALAALANAYETMKNYADAIETYDRIEKGSPLENSIEIRKAFNLNSMDQVDAASQTLLKLLDKGPVPQKAAVEPAAATISAPLDDSPTADKPLRLGYSDARVKKLQEALKKLGYDIGTPDAIFGDSTRRAVIQFQTSRGMEGDGLVGPATYAAILGAERKTESDAKPVTVPGAHSTSDRGLDVAMRLQVLDALGNIMRAHKRYGEAVKFYDEAISLIPKPESQHWAYFYARGTSFERLKNWPLAEADLQKALALQPDQPLVLNYLGYSWIDQGRNLKQGMALIEKAVAMKPEDGYIVDSLGWAHYKQGNFKEATRLLERAVELKPDDPVLNDHLGDALWRVGREREARFQWEQALTLNPEPEDAERIKKKLEVGLEPPAEAAPEKKNKAAEDPDPTKRHVTKAEPGKGSLQ